MKVTEADIGRAVVATYPNSGGVFKGTIRSINDKAVFPVIINVTEGPRKGSSIFCYHEEIEFVDEKQPYKFTPSDIGQAVTAHRRDGSSVTGIIEDVGPTTYLVDQEIKLKTNGTTVSYFVVGNNCERITFVDGVLPNKQQTGICDECQGTGQVELFNLFSPCSRGCAP